MTETAVIDRPNTSMGRRLLQRWPAAAGIAFAALVGTGLASGVEVAPVLAASAVIYLGAAALRRRSTAWPLFFLTVVVITVAKLMDSPVDPTWVVLGLGAVLTVVGLRRPPADHVHRFPLQTAALLGFGAVAALALVVRPDLGSYLVAAGLLGHAAWDVHHHRADRVVVRSMAEFCCVLDTALAVGIVVMTVLR